MKKVIFYLKAFEDINEAERYYEDQTDTAVIAEDYASWLEDNIEAIFQVEGEDTHTRVVFWEGIPRH